MKSSRFTQFLKHVWFIFLGIFIILLPVPIYLVLCIPVLIYRFMVFKIFRPCYRRDLGKAVSSTGASTGMAVEFMNENKNISPRWGIVTCLIFEGEILFDEIKEQIQLKWLNPIDSKTGELKYPEFQQFVEEWMGFLFWKRDNGFCLSNHLYSHEVPSSCLGETFVDNLVQNLLCKPFPPRKSPWEVHVVRNYEDPEFLEHTNRDKMTVFILRSHHAMADGFSVMSALVQGLFEISSDAFAFASPSSNIAHKLSPIKKFTETLKLPIRICHDLGYAISTIGGQPKTPFHFPEGKNKTKQLFGKSQLIPIKTIKEIKNNFGVSFTSVILSSIGAALAKTLKSKGYDGQMDRVLFGTALPLPQHPGKMKNHVTGTALKLCVKSDTTMTNANRLLQTDKDLKKAKETVIPLLLPTLAKLTSFHLAPVMRHLAQNHILPAGLSNFPGPLTKHGWKGRMMLGGHFASGTGIGTQGMVFSALSYNGHIRVVLTTEMEVLNSEEIKSLLDEINKEILDLHELSIKFRNEVEDRDIV